MRKFLWACAVRRHYYQRLTRKGSRRNLVYGLLGYSMSTQWYIDSVNSYYGV